MQLSFSCNSRSYSVSSLYSAGRIFPAKASQAFRHPDDHTCWIPGKPILSTVSIPGKSKSIPVSHFWKKRMGRDEKKRIL